MNRFNAISCLNLCLLFSCYSLAAQEYLPLPTENAEWSVLTTQSGNTGQLYTTTHYVPGGDTVMQGQLYIKLFSSSGMAFTPDSARYLGAYRNESGKVFFYGKG